VTISVAKAPIRSSVGMMGPRSGNAMDGWTWPYTFTSELRPGPSSLNPTNLCFEFNRLPSVVPDHVGDEDTGMAFGPSVSHSLGHSLGESHSHVAGDGQQHGIQDPMFVCVGQFLEQGQLVDVVAAERVGTPCWSVVRLKRLDECGALVAPTKLVPRLRSIKILGDL